MKKLILIPLLIVLTLTLVGCNESDVKFILIGDETLYNTVFDDYVEMGYLAHDAKTDISENVTIEGSVDISKSGDYLLTYTLNYQGETYTLERMVRYREEGCLVIPDTTITQCEIYWSQYLNTVVKLRLYYEDDTYHNAVQNIFNTVEYYLIKYHKLSDKYNTYDGVFNVKSINNDPATTHELEPELFDLIQFSLDHQDEVNNLFNIALGPVLAIWHDYREDCTTMMVTPYCAVPPMTSLQAANQFTDPSKIILDSDLNTITMEDQMSIDLGGVSKGYISGKIIEYLDSLNLMGYLLNNGTSNISIGGIHPTRDNQKYLLAITDPTFATDYYATVYLGPGDQLVTSGDYQQYYEVDGEIYHHIINPNTLMPERFSRSVSIITSDPALADLYSTAIFTMSIEDGLVFVNNIEGLEAIWYTIDDQAVMSENFKELYLVDLFINERSN